MSAPETNIEKQKRRHWPVITGIVAAAILATAAFLTFLGADENDAREPADASTATN